MTDIFLPRKQDTIVCGRQFAVEYHLGALAEYEQCHKPFSELKPDEIYAGTADQENALAKLNFARGMLQCLGMDWRNIEADGNLPKPQRPDPLSCKTITNKGEKHGGGQ